MSRKIIVVRSSVFLCRRQEPSQRVRNRKQSSLLIICGKTKNFPLKSLTRLNAHAMPKTRSVAFVTESLQATQANNYRVTHRLAILSEIHFCFSVLNTMAHRRHSEHSQWQLRSSLKIHSSNGSRSTLGSRMPFLGLQSRNSDIMGIHRFS